LNRSEDLLDALTNRSELEVGLPYLIEIHLVLGMNQEISHSRHTAPGEMTVLLAQLRAKQLERFSQYLDAADQRIP
jgi:hypothetical protein